MNNYQIEGEQRNTTTHIALFTINAIAINSLYFT